MKPGEVAVLLGIGRSTVTTWTMGEFKNYLTPSAQGGSGRPRNLTEQDVRILHFINEAKRNNVSSDELHLQLRQMQRDSWQDLPPFPEAPVGMANVPVIPTAAAEASLSAERRSLLREIAMLQSQIEKADIVISHERERNEELLREIAALRQDLGEVQAELRLYRAGRLRPED
jgi:DNA-binding transcriptional MerR regulator